MSSDESTSTQISAISSQLGIDQKLKPHKSEQWEIHLIGNFLLQLYHRLLLTPENDWTINKSDMRKEFNNCLTVQLKQKLRELNGTDNIGTLLHRCGFIINTIRGSNVYKIKSIALYEFRNKKLKNQDNWRLNNDVNNNMTQDDSNVLTNLVDKQANFGLEDKFEVGKDEPKNLLEYQGTTMTERQPNYYPTNMSCPICQEDFTTMESYEDHIQKHNDETEFEYLNSMSKHGSPIFTLSYRLCKNSHYFCFDIETKSENLVIEKIIIVQSRSLFYVHNMRVPYNMPDSGCEQFFVDSHLFTKYVEQPIVLICHLKDHHNTRIIEEHHFMRCMEFPKVGFAIKPYLLPDKKKFESKFQLADYFPPKEVQLALKDEFYNEKLMRVSNEFRDYVRNEKKLQPQTIGPSLNILLQIEDLDTLKQYFNLTQRDVKIRCFGNEYRFRLRPKERIFIENILTVFDEVILTSRPNISTKPEDLIQLMLQNKEDIYNMPDTYVGQIEDVNSSRITFKCYRKINLNRTYSVICRPSRLNIRYQYRSLEMLPVNMHFLKNFLFPAQIVPRPLSTISLTLYNKNISGNPEQLQTVCNIAEGPRNDATYIIFGPPGTGKTTTVVEAILQVLKRPDTKILVTASSNSACDEVAIRLCKQLEQLDIGRAIVRIYSRSSESRIDTIDDELLQHSNMYNGQFYPDIEILHEYRIVVCTLSIVAKLATGKFGRREYGGTQYTHVFIDEVAATMEAEALIGITAILTPKSSLIIAGDHKQLGPILQSKRAKELGLGVSLMDRLMARECYRVNTDTGDYDRTIQTRLRLNFRSHPDIVKLYSGMYYNHGLEAKAIIDDVSLVERWHLAQNKKYPIIFHSVYEPSCCDNQSKSMYNLQELNVVMDYVKDLMYFGINNEPVKETDIGIISPYKKQYKCIQEQLNLRKWFKIETGSVETFQGKEKTIIIVSFVRSGTPTLGFLENPRRLNVTISRAKSLLIMIGNPKTLSLNSDFEYIIKECKRHNTIVGSSSREARRDYFKRSTEKLNDNRTRNNSENNRRNKGKRHQQQQQQQQQQQKYTNSKPKANAADVTQTTSLNNLLQQLNITKPEDNANKRRRGGKANKRGRRGGKSTNNQQSKQNSENNSDNNSDDDDGDDSDVNTIDGDNKPSSSGAGRSQNHQISKNIKSHQSSATRGQGNSGKISKQYNKGKSNSTDNNKQQQKGKIELLFDDLPEVPKKNDIGTIKNPEVTVKAAVVAQHNLTNTPPTPIQQHPYQQYQTNEQQQPFNMANMPHYNAYNQPMPLLYNPAQLNFMQHQQQIHVNYMQQQQQQHAFVTNPSLNYSQFNFQNNMRMPLTNNNNMNVNSKPSFDNKSNNMNANSKPSFDKSNNKSNNTQKPTIAKTNSSTANTGIQKSKKVAKISPISNSSNKTTPANKMNKTTSGQQNHNAGSLKKASSLSNINNKTSTKTPGSATSTKAVTNQLGNKSTTNVVNPVSKNIQPLTAFKPISTSTVNSIVSNNNRPIPVTPSSASNFRQTTSAATPLSSYETSKNVSSSEATAILSSSGAIRKLPISQTNTLTTTATTASVRPLIRQSSSSISSASANTSSYAPNNLRTNNNFVDSYNAQTRLSTATTSHPTTGFGTLSTSSAASANMNNIRTNNNFVDSYNAPTHVSNTARPSHPVSRPIRQLQYDGPKGTKDTENKCIIS